MDKELNQISGQGEYITINGKQYSIKPLRLRDIIEIDKYKNTIESDFELRAYNIWKHLRDNEGVDLDFILDLDMLEINRIVTEIEEKLYPQPEAIKTESDN